MAFACRKADWPSFGTLNPRRRTTELAASIKPNFRKVCDFWKTIYDFGFTRKFRLNFSSTTAAALADFKVVALVLIARGSSGGSGAALFERSNHFRGAQTILGSENGRGDHRGGGDGGVSPTGAITSALSPGALAFEPMIPKLSPKSHQNLQMLLENVKNHVNFVFFLLNSSSPRIISSFSTSSHSSCASERDLRNLHKKHQNHSLEALILMFFMKFHHFLTFVHPKCFTNGKTDLSSVVGGSTWFLEVSSERTYENFAMIFHQKKSKICKLPKGAKFCFNQQILQILLQPTKLRRCDRNCKSSWGTAHGWWLHRP